MKKIDLGNNVNVEITDEDIKITSANGSTILLDCDGEFLSYVNEVGMKQAKERREILDNFVKIDAGKRKAVLEWLNNCVVDNEMQQNFLFWLGGAMAEVEYDYYIVELNDADEMIDVMNLYQHILPGYSLEDATKSEEIIWIAYNIANGYWTFKEGIAYCRRKNKTLDVLKK